MTVAHHPSLAVGRWRTLSLAEQLGNVGSEVHRSLRRYEARENEGFQLAFARALELLDLTIADPRWKTGRRELTRAREVLCDFFIGGNRYRSEPTALQSYFDQFALVARGPVPPSRAPWLEPRERSG